MKNRQRLVLLRKQDAVLQQKYQQIHLSVLNQLCKAHMHVSGVPDLRVLLRKGMFDAALALCDEWSAQSYSDPNDHFVHNQFAALIRKYPWDKLNANPEATAVRGFDKAEHKCFRMNQKLRARRANKPYVYENEFHRMRAFITYVIGQAPSVQNIFDQSAFGPGANVGVSRSTNFARKLLADQWTVSPGAFTYGYVSVMDNVHFRQILIPEHAGFTAGDGDFVLEKERYHTQTHIVKHNKIAFVPKTALVHRTIAIEPLINGFLQKGVDLEMRKMLLRVGIDLSDQSINQVFARKGSLPGEVDPFVTIDLSAASDSISIEAIRELLPYDWFNLLNRLRSHEYELKGVTKTYQKFCSMGNGFCFPLQTLVFASAAVAVNAGIPGVDFLVYGDDIIVKQSVAKPLIDLLAYLGFKTNSGKTFLDGPFRESCGADWYGGEDVRPFTLDFRLDSVQSIFKFLNLSRRNRRTEEFFSPVRSYILERLPEPLRFFRPFPRAADSGIDGTGDEHLLASTCRFNTRQMVWECVELQVTAKPDDFWLREERGPQALLWGALVGAASTAPFSFRGKTRTKVSWKTNSAATNQWTPPDRLVLKRSALPNS